MMTRSIESEEKRRNFLRVHSIQHVPYLGLREEMAMAVIFLLWAPDHSAILQYMREFKLKTL
jgi:hypothetical protein